MGIKSHIKNIMVKEKQVPVFINISSDNMLNGKTALIIGGTSGIGFAIAETFVKSGANVIVCGRNTIKIDNAVKQLKVFGNVYGFQLDISNINLMQDMIARLMYEIPYNIDILVNSAGVNLGGKFGNIKEEDYDKVIDTNLKGTLFVSQIISNYMIEKDIKGNILNIASVGAFRPADTVYRISKWGLRGLTLGMAKSLIKYDIVVNGIAPGPTATEMLGASNDDLSRKENPSRRMTSVEEVAELAKHLVSNSGRMIVGDMICISGGGGGNYI
jgi:NAD(P)-dependent dehydrogenase (short-subunit alcohol dehydrogenase family)